MPQAPNPTHEAYTPEQMIDAIKQTKGFVSTAAQMLGCSTVTVYSYINKYSEIKEVLDKERTETKEEMIDIAEKTLFEKINEGNMTALIFFLKCQAKNRGYSERYQIVGADDGPIKQEIEVSEKELNKSINSKLDKINGHNKSN